MPAEAAYTFAGFRLEPAERRLTGAVGPVPLPPKAFDLLVILVSSAGRLLRKEELMEQLWPGVFVEEVNLAQNVSALRRALGGHDRKAFIETVAGAGYRFVAPVQALRDGSGSAAAERPPRLIVLPFRLLTPDPEIAFLSFSLADALSASLAELDTIVVRSSLTAAKYAGDAADLARLARETDVTLVVSGTLARSDDDLRVSVQLSDAAAGTLIWSCTETGSAGRLFAMHDALVGRIAGSLAHPLSAREERQLRRDVPRSARAYEYYLRGNHASADSDWPVARDLYLQAIEEDASFAPAWARLARVYRLIGKYRPEARDASFARAEDALRRALALNPELSMAHALYAQIDADRGEAETAMVRLLERASVRPPDADSYAGLVHACRYCGLLDASLAAHSRARHLDETLATSVMHTLFVMGRYDEVLAAHGLIKGYVYVMSLFSAAGRRAALDASVQLLKEGTRVAPLVQAARAMFEDRRDDSLAVIDQHLKTLTDPEGLYYVARHCAFLESSERALAALTRAIDGGYFCYPGMAGDPWFDPVRGDAGFGGLVERARKGHRAAAHAFISARGQAILGVEPEAV
jgi:DNA-binding winged helix-turn-helix (wHTH) protein/tetratricopeptide (TPR) repeat protein